MIFEEDREGTGGAFGAHIKDRNFLNGARHSVYYKRTENSSVLMVNHCVFYFFLQFNQILTFNLLFYCMTLMQVDRDPIELKKIPVLSLTDTLTDMTAGDNEVQIGGLHTTDPRFASYTSYGGCISSNFYNRLLYNVNYIPRYQWNLVQVRI